MRYIELLETPIGDLEYRSDTTEPTSFSQKDINLLKNETHVERVRKAFSKTPYVFDLYFYNLKNLKMNPLKQVHFNGSEFTDKFPEDFNNFIRKHSGETTPAILKQISPFIDVNPNPKSITCIYFSNSDVVTRHPLTPWIMAHRFAHALLDGYNRNRLSSSRRGMERIDHLISNMSKEFHIPEHMTMKSVKADDFRYSEVIPELIAQYLIQGKVTFKRTTFKSDIFDSGASDPIDNYETEINLAIKETLDGCVGKVFATA